MVPESKKVLKENKMSACLKIRWISKVDQINKTASNGNRL